MDNQEGFILSGGEVKNITVQAEKMFGKINYYHRDRSLETIYSALSNFKRVAAFRCDLRFAQDMPGGDPDSVACFERADSSAITRFIESLKSRLREKLKREGKRVPAPLFEYIWVREQDRSLHPHYHVILFFNRDHYAFRGNYTDTDADNMATRIQRAWCSALGVEFPYYASLVHFPDKGGYRFNQKDAITHTQEYRNCLQAVSYFWKISTKDIGDGGRNFACSQG